MKKGFTMIELIFVIVILGILATIAIPKLAATRDDAEVVKATTNIKTMISDINAYYTSQGNFSVNIADMTNVANPVAIKGTMCFNVGKPVDTNLPAGEIPVQIFDNIGLCQRVWQQPGISQIATEIENRKKKSTYPHATLRFGGPGIDF